MMRLIRKDRSFFIFRKPEQNDIDLTNKTLQTKILTIDTGVFMKHYLENIDEVCREVKTGVDGITSQEAESRLESNGKNKLAEGKKEPIILRLLKQFIEPMTLILSRRDNLRCSLT